VFIFSLHSHYIKIQARVVVYTSNPHYSGGGSRIIISKPAGYSLSLKQTQVVEHLPSKHEVLGSIPSATHTHTHKKINRIPFLYLLLKSVVKKFPFIIGSRQWFFLTKCNWICIEKYFSKLSLLNIISTLLLNITRNTKFIVQGHTIVYSLLYLCPHICLHIVSVCKLLFWYIWYT
jgi:hypothetical protein